MHPRSSTPSGGYAMGITGKASVSGGEAHVNMPHPFRRYAVPRGPNTMALRAPLRTPCTVPPTAVFTSGTRSAATGMPAPAAGCR